ncbi:MAG TPA: ABC transporter permease [Vicinamibacterales bacterium]
MSGTSLEPSPRTWEITSEIPGPLHTLADVWTYRRLTVFLGVRSLRKIYRRTILGWLWLFIIPLFPVALRTLVFGMLLGVMADGIPYFLFLMAGTVVWDLFAIALLWGTRGLELHGGTQDVYVPRVIMPIGAMALAVLDLVIKLGVLAATIAYFWARDGRSYLAFGSSSALIVVALLLAVLFAFSLALFTSVWSERTREVRFVLNQLTAVWYVATPVLYPMSSVPEEWRTWVLLNPMAPITNAFNYGLFGIGEPHLRELGIAALVALALLTAGIRYFAAQDAATIDAR